MKNNKKKLSLLQKRLIVVGAIVATLIITTLVLYGLQLAKIVDFINEYGEENEETHVVTEEERPGYFEFLYRLFGGKPKEVKPPKGITAAKHDKDGDLLGTSDRPYIYEVIPFEKVLRIEIQNVDPESGEKRNFSFDMDPVAENLILTGREMLSFDKEKLSYLYVNTCNMLAMSKVSNPTEDLAQYGLPGGKSDNWFIVTTVDGEKKQVYIGDKIPTGAAYYCKSADKPHIYVIDTMIESCVLASPEDYIVPMLTPPVSQQEMYKIDDIKIIRDGELFVNLVCAPEKDADNNDGTAFSHIMTYPGGYTVSQAEVDTIISTLASFIGDSVVVADLSEVFLAAGGDGDNETNTVSVTDDEQLGNINTPVEIVFFRKREAIAEPSKDSPLGYVKQLAEQYETKFDFIEVKYVDMVSYPAESNSYKNSADDILKIDSVVVYCPATGKKNILQITDFFTFDESGNISAFNGRKLITSNILEVTNPDNSESDENTADNTAQEKPMSPGDAALNEVLEKYGIKKPSREIHYRLGDKEYMVIFGDKTPDGNSYYAMNMTQRTICTVPCSTVAFLDYELIDYVDEYIFQMNIDNLSSVEVKTRNSHETFLLTGDKKDLIVKKQSDGEAVDTKTFRQFYIDVLLVTLTGKADSYDTSNEVLAYTFTTRDGRTFEYKFYDISTTKVFYTVDGKGEFYVNRDSVTKVINNFDMLLSGQTFMSEALGG